MCRIMSNPILLIYFILIIENCFTDDKGQNESEFVPTHEWQVVRKGQAIPKGLHVRMNFETGVTEAKLIDEEHSQRTDLSLSEIKPEAIGEQEQSDNLLATDVIKEALRKIKSDEASKETNKKVNKFRSYEQLKKEIASLNLTTKIDGEILNDLFIQHDKETAKKELEDGTIVRILEDFDFLVHQFDNGLEFVRQNGFDRLIYKNFNSSSGEIKKNTLKLFGSLVQNNGKVQIHALETGSIPIILRLLNLETNTQVKSSAVFALSCLLRRFPFAQLHFIENGGVSVVAKLLRDDPIKIQTKVVTLMNDLLLENIHAREDTSTEGKMLVNWYKLVNLEKLLLENDWCNHLNTLMSSVLATASSDHDSIEKCLISMKTLAGQCNNHFDEDVLIKMLNNYKNLVDDERKMSESDGGDNFFVNIHELCVDILNSRKNIKTEL